VHNVGQVARRARSQQRRHQRVIDVVEGECELGEVAGAYAAAERWWTPAESVEVGGSLTMLKMSLG
jgi:hypothetical protein